MNTLIRLAASVDDVIQVPLSIWDLSPWGIIGGLVIIFYWLTASGRLIPRSSHERELAQSNKRGDEWKETALEGRELIKAQSKQLDKFAEASKTPAEFFGAVMKAGGDDSASKEDPSHV